MAKLTVLQLDTAFPRLPGDVASPESYDCAVDIVTIPAATVKSIVTDDPDRIDISGFETAVDVIESNAVDGDIITTSCGFLGYWQTHLASRTRLPFIASALMDLPRLTAQYGQRLGILTFDARTLCKPAYADILAGFSGRVIGLPTTSHLHQVISQNTNHMDSRRAETEIIDLVGKMMMDSPIDALLLECTNLPPYKAALKAEFGLEIYDILTVLHDFDAQMVKPYYH
ncbi:aspartate/glutamate racemase family protein [Alphaproteobacteria bacterium]|nr:aspartate/glutamate racemase family protein [Alphaproteobacteria bacterium]